MVDQTDSGEFDQLARQFQRDYQRIVEQVQTVIVGMTGVIEQVMTCLLAGGHVLLEGVPGLGKTLLVRTLADALDLQFSRIQFTPDLMPADIIGTNMVVADEAGSKNFQFQRGPIFGNVILADEINRATPKTQSAVLEAMQEQTVSVARTRHKLPGPFFVLATQNPLEMEGTYPLPEAQLDRFMFKVLVPAPTMDEMQAILDRTTTAASPAAQKVVTGERVLAMQQAARQVVMASHVRDYIARLAMATQPGNPDAPQSVRKFIRYGCSPRGGQAIVLAAKVAALKNGRANMSFEDAAPNVAPALRHRLILSFEGQAEGVEMDSIITDVLESVRPG